MAQSSQLFPDDAKHLPDCSSVTDEELQWTIESRWPVQNGVSTIPYSFSTSPYWASPLVFLNTHHLLPERVTDELIMLMKRSIRFGLDRVTEASNGRLKFVENNNVNPFSPGIYFYISGSLEYLSRYNLGATTYIKTSFNGELNQAFVFFVNDEWFWKYSKSGFWSMYSKTHEIIHALGFKHLHEYPSILKKLQNIKDGAYCSTSVYPDLITTNTSMCHVDCNPPYAIYPGELDARMIRLSMNDLSMDYFSREKLASYASSTVEALLFPFLASFFYNTVASCVAHLEIYKNKPVFSKNTAFLIADSGIIAALISLNFPEWVVGAYSFSSTTKFIPKKYLDKMPEKVKSLLLSHYNFYILSISCAYIKNLGMVPFLITAAISLLSWKERSTDYSLGRAFASVLNYIPQTITHRLCKEKPSPIIKEDEKSTSLAILPEHSAKDAPLLNGNIHLFFDKKPPQRKSYCSRFLSLFGCGRRYVSDEEENSVLEVRCHQSK